jgi:hypothetical protein
MAGEDKNPPPPPQHSGQVKLAAFWPQAPALWFAQAECTFAVKRVVAQFDHYCHVVAALPHESIRLVADIVEGEPSETPYDDIKQRLVASHQLLDFQKAERLFQMPALGGRKPSELMAARWPPGCRSLCIKHWRYGEAASSCEQPCSWQGNGGAGGN